MKITQGAAIVFALSSLASAALAPRSSVNTHQKTFNRLQRRSFPPGSVPLSVKEPGPPADSGQTGSKRSKRPSPMMEEISGYCGNMFKFYPEAGPPYGPPYRNYRGERKLPRLYDYSVLMLDLSTKEPSRSESVVEPTDISFKKTEEMERYFRYFEEELRELRPSCYRKDTDDKILKKGEELKLQGAGIALELKGFPHYQNGDYRPVDNANAALKLAGLIYYQDLFPRSSDTVTGKTFDFGNAATPKYLAYISDHFYHLTRHYFARVAFENQKDAIARMPEKDTEKDATAREPKADTERDAIAKKPKLEVDTEKPSSESDSDHKKQPEKGLDHLERLYRSGMIAAANSMAIIGFLYQKNESHLEAARSYMLSSHLGECTYARSTPSWLTNCDINAVFPKFENHWMFFRQLRPELVYTK